jgi:hypothetical protein
MAVSSLAEVVGDPDVFLAEHLNRRALVRRGAVTHGLHELLSIRELDDVVALEAVPPSYLRVAKDGVGLSTKAYTRTLPHRDGALTEVVVPEKVYELFRSGATVTWNSLHHLLPAVRRLLAVFTRAFASHGDAVAFLTPAGRTGYAPHHDPVDVYVIQVEGTKSWRLWDTPAVRGPGEATYTPEQLGPPSQELVLAPGDVLYLPFHTPHAAAAGDAVSLHLSLTIQPRRWRDLVRETVERLVADTAFDDVPYLGSGRPETVAELGNRLRLLADRLSSTAPEVEARRLAAGAPSARREFERLASVEVTEDSVLRRSALAVAIGASAHGRTDLSVNGHRVAVPDAVAAALRTLDGGGSIAATGLLPGVSATRSIRAARTLTRLGVLEVADDSRS